LFLIAAATILFLLSALSKESGLIFPVLALALTALRKQWNQTWKIALVIAFVCASYFSLRLGAEHYPPPVLTPPAPPLVKPIVMSRAIAEYACLILLPLNLHMDRDVESHPSGLNEPSITASAWRELQTLLGIILAAAFAYWMFRARTRNFPVFVCLTLFVISYLPISDLVALNSTVAEHWLYLPGAFLFLAAILQILSLGRVQERAARSTTAFAVSTALILWVVFLGARTFIRTFDWKDERTFFERTIAHGGDSARMLINLGALEMNEGKMEDSALHFHAALQKKPDQPFAMINLAAIALKQNDLKLARQLLERAVKMEAVEAQANEMLTVLEHKESGRANVMRMRLASRTGTPNWSIEKRYVLLLDQTGAHIVAIKELQDCLTKQWYRAESWQLLGELLNKANLRDLAALAFNRAHQYDVHLEAHEGAQSLAPAPLPSS
jgi:tetratricopeptide (TPR) repeat protein